MPPTTELALLALEPGPAEREEREWTVTFQLAWGDDRRPLPVVVRAPDCEGAEAQARQAVADRLIQLAGQAARASLSAVAAPPGLARPRFMARRPSAAPRRASA